ncbi:MAG TPA: site-specific integrase, partial [Flavisolibacter sp.]|nr:site-specific integrase [Flavisolibacter sp.]
GPLPIYLRITIDGGRVEMSTKRMCEHPEKWNAKAGRVTGNKETIKTLNAHLDILQSKVYETYKDLLQDGKTITAEAIKNKLQGVTERPRMILEIFRFHNEGVRTLIGNGFSPQTFKRYETTLQHTSEFLQWKYRVPDLEIRQLTVEVITEFEFYLLSVRRCGYNTTVKYLTNFKKVVGQCIQKGWLSKNPFTGVKLAPKEVVRETLTQEELDRIETKTFSTERLSMARDVFLFSCYTGLAYADVLRLQHEDIRIGIDGGQWIFARRQKTEAPFRIPLLTIPLKMIERYKDHPKCVSEGKVLPVPSNQKMNEYLKEIAALCGIQKRLTYHMARHTFATTVTLNNGVPIETVSKLLGHKNLRITQHYAKILDRKISEDMQTLKQKMTVLHNKAS